TFELFAIALRDCRSFFRLLQTFCYLRILMEDLLKNEPQFCGLGKYLSAHLYPPLTLFELRRIADVPFHPLAKGTRANCGIPDEVCFAPSKVCCLKFFLEKFGFKVWTHAASISSF